MRMRAVDSMRRCRMDFVADWWDVRDERKERAASVRVRAQELDTQRRSAIQVRSPLKAWRGVAWRGWLAANGHGCNLLVTVIMMSGGAARSHPSKRPMPHALTDRWCWHCGTAALSLYGRNARLLDARARLRTAV